MLLTFEDFAELPDKMHAFYSQAFDTLFQKHDAQKQQFQRQTHSGLSREDFKKCFAAFSAMSYLEEKFVFEEGYVMSTAEKAIYYTKNSSKITHTPTARQFVDDLFQSVCLLQKDGLNTVYVHRSFQEYFAAVFATTMHGPKARKVLDKYACRFGDSVISMARDMDRESVELDWVIPTLDDLEPLFEGEKPAVYYTWFCRLFPTILLHKYGDRVGFSFPEIKLDLLGPLETLCRLYPTQLGPGLPVRFLRSRGRESARKMFMDQSVDMHRNFDKIAQFIESKQRSVQIDLTVEDKWWLERAGIGTSFDKLVRGFKLIRRDIQRSTKTKSIILNEFL